MDYAKFIKEVRVRINAESEEETLNVIQAVFESLSEHLCRRRAQTPCISAAARNWKVSEKSGRF
jgi:uncharacterized protein (DUF2267 family)